MGDCAPSDPAGERFAVSGHGFSAKATLKKLVIPDGCADTRSQRLFVCK
jgi:hypothetical protein